jgi:hypothetical protein
MNPGVWKRKLQAAVAPGQKNEVFMLGMVLDQLLQKIADHDPTTGVAPEKPAPVNAYAHQPFFQRKVFSSGAKCMRLAGLSTV